MKEGMDLKTKNDIGTNKIATYRKKLGDSQGVFAEKIGTSQQRVSLLEKNETCPKSFEIENMLEVFNNVTFDELFDTGRESVYISSSNGKQIMEYISSLSDVFSVEHTDYQKKSILVNYILKMFFEGRLGDDSTKESIKREVLMSSDLK
jgi:DNA-binding XRE family transcriptional regulator